MLQGRELAARYLEIRQAETERLEEWDLVASEAHLKLARALAVRDRASQEELAAPGEAVPRTLVAVLQETQLRPREAVRPASVLQASRVVE